MRVSVTIPCRNEERYIECCVRSVLTSDYSGSIRVLVCDGKSEDRTQEIVRSLAQSDARVELLINDRQTTPFALNLGIKHASDCDVHIILGAHAEIAPDYIKKCVDHLRRDHSIGCVGGILDNVNEDHESEMIAKAMSSPIGVGSAHFRTGAKSGFVDTVAFGAYRKEVFDRVGYFDEDLTRNQDDEFNYRVLKGGFKIFLDPTIRAKYYVRASMRKLQKQYYQYGYWKVYVNRKHGSITSLRQLAPPALVLFWLSGFVIIFIPTLSVIWGICLASYFILTIVGAIRQRAKGNDIAGVALAMMIMHMNYGVGYMIGFFRFMIFRMNPSKQSASTSR